MPWACVRGGHLLGARRSCDAPCSPRPWRDVGRGANRPAATRKRSPLRSPPSSTSSAGRRCRPPWKPDPFRNGSMATSICCRDGCMGAAGAATTASTAKTARFASTAAGSKPPHRAAAHVWPCATPFHTTGVATTTGIALESARRQGVKIQPSPTRETVSVTGEIDLHPDFSLPWPSDAGRHFVL